jgi:hypothetical protein
LSYKKKRQLVDSWWIHTTHLCYTISKELNLL